MSSTSVDEGVALLRRHLARQSHLGGEQEGLAHGLGGEMVVDLLHVPAHAVEGGGLLGVAR